jgi:hypothetical protein
MNKTISINPDLFRFAKGGKSRKNTPSDKTNEIKVRAPVKEKDKQKKMRKQHVLRFIREQQEKNYQKLTEDAQIVSSHKQGNSKKDTNDVFNSDFDESLKYLMTLTENKDPEPVQGRYNHTIRKYPAYKNSSNAASDLEPLVYTGGLDDHDDSQSISLHAPKFTHASPPKWGCMKNGSLPTYRTWNNHTQKRPITSYPMVSTPIVSTPIVSTPIVTTSPINLRNLEQRAMMSALTAQTLPNPINRYLKQKRTVRRTYKLGRSKIHPKIGVLISNRTIRNQCMTAVQGLKQTPIDDVKRFLVKNGFIRVGSSAPNDVLRKMYETAKTMCGEIENHNPDNMLYNYLHDVAAITNRELNT